MVRNGRAQLLQQHGLHVLLGLVLLLVAWQGLQGSRERVAPAPGHGTDSWAVRTNGTAQQAFHQTRSPRKQGQRALVSLLTDTAADAYVRGAAVLLKSALQHAPG